MPIVTCRRQKCLIAGRQKRSDVFDVGEAIQWIERQIAAHAVSQDTHQVTHAPAVVISHPTLARPPLEMNCQQLLPAIHNHAPIAVASACQVMATRRESLLQVQGIPFRHVLAIAPPQLACQTVSNREACPVPFGRRWTYNEEMSTYYESL